MKIQCDNCSAGEAAVYCPADEAALCGACDHRVHHANKLASKHQRFSLHHPSAKDFPLCDVCQEKRAFLFCQQDRAILCKDCDGPIHKANEHTLKHNRFLLTGVKLSASSDVYSADSSNDGDVVPNLKSVKDQPSKKQKLGTVCAPNSNSTASAKSLITANSTIEKAGSLDCVMNNKDDNLQINGGFDSSSSTISEYLMETLPGWCVEDLLDFPATPFGFCKGDEEILPMVGTDLGGNMCPFSTENLGIWVPQAPSSLIQSHYLQMGSVLKEGKEVSNTKNSSRNWADDAFTVPQMSPPSSGLKRNRPFW